MKAKYTHGTDCGSVIRCSYINTGNTPATVGGYVQSCPVIKYKIAIREAGDGWEALYDMGGDDCGISSDNLADIISIGRMDDSNTTVSAALTDGARDLHAWADRIRAIDPDNEDLAELAEYLDERATDAEHTASDRDRCNELADEYNMDHEDDDEAGQ